ncbi:hypothetical protein [Parasedimentitalea psychrophila]|uniref:Uncharacterized protein n=1 Tax=Parasedimentitalea psychrophila TaxID=2997337 RepID=A0A9Y2KZL2_9RHOB|nr:hypothetical protein [Parasedimentitalea psychrophila]WIY24807.1 hypothetical protein QPJ95_20255 [Parasedimentitalea psychrophila]
MQVRRVKTAMIADNDDHPPGVTPIPRQSIEGEISADAQAELLAMIAEVNQGPD